MPTDAQAAPQTLPARTYAVVEHSQPIFDTMRFEGMQRAAKALMFSSLLPDTIRGAGPDQCFSNLMLVFDLSTRWNIPPLSVAQGIAIVYNKVVYEGKLVAAIIEGALGRRLSHHYTGERGTPGYRVYVSDRNFDEMTDQELADLRPAKYPRGWRIIDGSVGEWQTMQKDGRTPNPAWTGQAQHNQLAYRGDREWARFYESGLLLGVYGEDEMQGIEDKREAARQAPPAINPADLGFMKPAASAAAPGSAAGPAPADEAIDAEFVDATAEAMAASIREGLSKDLPAEEEKPAAKTTRGRKAGAPKDEAPAADLLGADDIEKARVAGHAAGKGGGDLAIPKLYAANPKAAEAWAEGINAGMAERLENEGDALGDSGDGEDDAPEPAQSEANEDEQSDGDEESDGESDGDAEVDFDGALEDEQIPVDEFDSYILQTEGPETWPELKGLLGGLSRLDVWKEALKTPAGQEKVRRARVATAEGILRLAKAAGGNVVDITSDFTAYRCMIEIMDDKSVLTDTWQQVVMGAAYAALSPAGKGQMEAVTMARIKAVGG